MTDGAELGERCWAREDAGEHVKKHIFTPRRFWQGPWPVEVKIICKDCGQTLMEKMPFGEWVEAAYVAARLGADCWLQDTFYAKMCSCRDCYRKHRYPDDYGPTLAEVVREELRRNQ